MNHQDLYKVIQTVQKNVRCPQCGESYDFLRINIRGIMDAVIFLELFCKNHAPLFATVAFNQSNRNNKTAERVGSNDVIAAHKFLNNFRGSFDVLFRKTKPKQKK